MVLEPTNNSFDGGCNGYTGNGAWGVLPVIEISASVFSMALKISNTVTNPGTLPC